jgi:RimJ/RimL family protein N-acetyltransferase
MQVDKSNDLRWLKIQEEADYQRLVELEHLVYPPDDCITASEYLDYQVKGNRVWILTRSDEWIANYQISTMPTDAPAECFGLYISGLAVFRPYQGQGYGHLAFSKLVTKFGCSQLSARVRTENPGPRSLLRKFGFEYCIRESRREILWDWFTRQASKSMD